MKKITFGLFLVAAVSLWSINSAKAHDPDILFTGAGADLTFYYQSTGNGTGTWYTVFRAKGTVGNATTTIATDLEHPFTGFTGINGNIVPAFDGATGDYEFGTLTVKATSAATVTVGATVFYALSASGSPFVASPATPDLGIRTRFQSQSTNQFPGGMRLTLDLAGSSFNGSPLSGSGAHVSLLHWDSFNLPVPLINTDGGSLFTDFAMSGHVHRNWGFSQAGVYELAFTMQGLGGTGDYAGAPTGSTIVTFDVVPEPSTGALIIGGLALATWLRRRMVRG
jgi:surface-anchored protein